MPFFAIDDAGTHLVELVERTLDGENVVLTRRGKAAVRLTPVERIEDRSDLFGAMAGEIHIADDFDQLPADIAEALGGDCP